MLHKFTRPGWTSLHLHTHVPSSMLTSVLGCAMASHTEVLAPIPSPHFGSLPTSVNSNSLVLPDAQAKALGVIPDTTPDPNHLQFTLNFKLCLEVNKSSPPPPNTTGSNTIISLLDHCNDLLTDLSQSDPLAICQTTSHFCSKPSNKSPSFAAWNPKPSHSPQDSAPLDLVTLWPQHLLLLPLPLLPLFLSHASHTPTSGLCFSCFHCLPLSFPNCSHGSLY